MKVLIDKNIGKLSVGISIIPNNDHILLPNQNKASELDILRQMADVR